MPEDGFVRVVAVRKGKVRATEFRLRDGEIGLSLFRSADQPGPSAILAAVRGAGKQSELGAAEIPCVSPAGAQTRTDARRNSRPSGERFARGGPAAVAATTCFTVPPRADPRVVQRTHNR